MKLSSQFCVLFFMEFFKQTDKKDAMILVTSKEITRDWSVFTLLMATANVLHKYNNSNNDPKLQLLVDVLREKLGWKISKEIESYMVYSDFEIANEYGEIVGHIYPYTRLFPNSDDVYGAPDFDGFTNLVLPTAVTENFRNMSNHLLANSKFNQHREMIESISDAASKFKNLTFFQWDKLMGMYRFNKTKKSKSD